MRRRNKLQKEVSKNKASFKINSNRQQIQTVNIEEDLYLTSNDENIEENQVDVTPETSSVKRK